MTETEFIQAHQGIARRVAQIHFKPGLRLGLDDLVSLALEGILRASRAWVPGRGKPSTYAWVKARSRVVDGIRDSEGRRRRRPPILEVEFEEGLFRVREPEAWDVEDVWDLDKALGGLSSREWDVIQARYYQGLTLREVARVFGVSYQTVQNYERRALGKLRETLTRGGVSPDLG